MIGILDGRERSCFRCGGGRIAPPGAQVANFNIPRLGDGQPFFALNAALT